MAAATLGSLPTEIISLVALHGPLLRLRRVVRFDLPAVAATKISQWYRRICHKRVWPSIGDRVVVRWPSVLSRRQILFGTVAGNSGDVDGRQMWKICFLDGSYGTAHFIWRLDGTIRRWNSDAN